ncbi:sodium-coupled monocarboxylate transporter 1-like isoform X2 [Siniperca chuatsi]|uniref:sodium-coupled monocarboxylate transporter 1-like isoform X2 n=1 Tax=Siniperca chuatsi TaxID=119488 RepID=UPI001CE07D40|nr:sodium-coupled monocarboxylate transporter 1-like isoform X2 [Siniperca chuatsi]
MSGDSLVSGSFVVADYLVFALMLVLSAAVGVYYAWVDKGQRSSGDFLMGGRRLTALPVSMSLTASFMSAITVLSNPAEVYRYGANIGFYGLSYVMTMVLTSEVFLPVFYRLAITSTYEYLELRFSRATRLLGTVLFIVQTILYTGIVIYAPALALNQVTGMDLWGAVISTGVVCTFYCTMGGLKAVVWTDVFQLGVMLAGFLSVIIRSVVLQGGVFPIISDSQQGGRLNFWDFDTNPLRRHTFWTITIGGTFVWVSIYGINQAQVQRYISCKSITHAKLSLYINLLGLLSILLCSVFAGMCLFSVYKNCDPWTAGLVSAPDQLMPYLVMDILGDYPGLPGLFVAAAYSGSLSTVSSSINALAAVTVEDLIKPYTNMSEKHLSWTSKGLSLIYGVLCIGMAGLASLMGGILQAAISIFGVIGGPLLGLFTLGILCPFANSKGALSGLVSGLVVSLWVGIGAQIYPPPPAMARPLSLTTEGCNFTTTDSLNWTSTALPTQPTSITTVSVHNIDGLCWQITGTLCPTFTSVLLEPL